jgi:hypothetical protein
VNVSELRALYQKVILQSPGGDKGKLFLVHVVKCYGSETTATLILSQTLDRCEWSNCSPVRFNQKK